MSRFTVDGSTFTLGEGGSVTLNGVTYVGGPDGCISVQNSRSSNPTTHYTTHSTSKPSKKPSSTGDILNDLRAQRSGSSQLQVLEDWLSKLADAIPAQQVEGLTLAQIVGLFSSGTNQVSALQQCVDHGVNDFQVAHAVKIVQCIQSGTYQKDAVQGFVRLFNVLTCEEVAQIVNPIRSDTYVVDAIGILVPKMPVTATNFVLLTQCCRSDTYKVDVLKHIRATVPPDEYHRILRDMHSDTYRIDATKTIRRNPQGDYWRSISTIQSDTYKVDFAKVVKPFSIKAHELGEIINRMSKSYRADLLKHWLPSLLEENVEDMVEMADNVSDRCDLLKQLLKRFPSNPTLQALNESAQEALRVACSEAGFKININGFLLDIEHYPMNVAIEINLGGKIVEITRESEGAIRIENRSQHSNISITQVPFSGIHSITAVNKGGSAMIGGDEDGNLVVPEGAVYNVICTGSQSKATLVMRDNVVHSKSSNVSIGPMKYLGKMLNHFIPETKSVESKMEVPKEAPPVSSECCICLSAPAVGVFTPCGHKCACMECGQKVEMCPTCRGVGAFLHISYIDTSKQKVFL